VIALPNRVLVTGAAGRIGRATLDALAAAGVATTALVLDDPGDLAADTVVVGSAADPAVVRQAMAGAGGVIHLAATPVPDRGTPQDVYGGNTLATFTVLDEAGRAGVPHAIIASSYAATGLPFSRTARHPAYLPVDVAMPAQVEDPYGLSKQADELTAAMMARRYGLSVVALRYPFVGGFGDRLSERAALLAADPGAGAHDLWAYLETRDAAAAALLALRVELTEPLVAYVAAPRTLVPYPTEELLRRFHPGVRRHGPPLPGRTVPLDLSDAEQVLGFTAQYEIELDERPLEMSPFQLS
jgi:nucleoside-diphosphate-sugar epimerase